MWHTKNAFFRKMQFWSYCYTVVSYQALFRLSVYKIPAVYLSGAKYVCFCTIRDFGSPTTYYSNYKYGYTFNLIYLTFICKEPFPAVLYFCLTFILLDNFACSFGLLIFFKITLLLKQILSLIASVSKTKYEFRSLIEYK